MALPKRESSRLTGLVGAVEDALVVVAAQARAIAPQGREGLARFSGNRVGVLALGGSGCGAEEDEFGHLVGEFLVFHGADLDERCQGFPDLGVALGLVPMQFLQPVADLLGDEVADGAHAAVRLQGGAADVQRDVRGIDHTPQREEIAGNDFLDGVADEDLVAVELDFALFPVSPAG